ncbi:cytochrome c biogenesis protein ResB [Chitiniphilus eburneus]|uniref:Cytochrome c biogenesis protein ResB n=1 Tax=Chitiniphilus eburneus TaxID=2571148 RepID=A0A4V5MPV1_9NEIS|nr:cytochrome c biogenesis protein ResB [Chitiniphilus eburneus]TJZ70078.1 cytochrome c biogenesis protein ResB [Chitiniphilus eburneus]
MTEKRLRHLSFGRALFDLLSSMRFAIGLLSVLAIASVIGTVLKQNEPYVNYRIEFGDFWFSFFEPLGLFDVYHAAWFLLILVFLVLSVSLCIWRHLPGMLRDIRSFREHASHNSLRLMSHHVEMDGEPARDAVEAGLTRAGFRFRVREADGVRLYAAKKGIGQRLGYFFAHAAIVVICIGGLLDGNLPLKLRELTGSKTPELRDVPQSQVPPQSRLGTDNPAFRGNVTIPEGGTADVIFLNAGQGYFVQDLPFALRLKQFHVEHYSTGQPKRFASEVDVLDRNSGAVLKSATVEVNKPLVYDGIAIYQSSFGDGGSPLTFARWDLGGAAQPQPLQARSQASQALTAGGNEYTLELGDLRVFNIENMGRTEAETSTVAVNRFEQALADAQSVKADHNLRNLGPSVQFKLRDAAGQAVEYLNYLAPFSADNALYLLSGMRREVSAPFAYVRIPLDDAVTPVTFMHLRATLLDASLYPEIARRTTQKAFQSGGFSATKREQFQEVTESVLTQFGNGGFPALDRFLQAKVPEAQRATVAQTYLKILQGAAIDALEVAQERAGQPAITMDAEHYRFLMDSLVAASAMFEYGAPVYLQPTGFEEVQASGFQLARAPGQTIVYLGCLLLVIGIYCMFYLREERIWLRSANGRTLLAMAANRHDSELDQAFDRYRTLLLPHGGTTEDSPDART